MKEKIIIAAIASAAAISAAGCANPAGLTDGSGASETEESLSEEVATHSSEDTAGDSSQDIQEPIAVYVKYVRVTSDGVNIRGGAGTGYSVYGSAEKDTYYAYVGETDGWYKIYYLNSTAYISKQYSKAYEMAASDNEVVESVVGEGAMLLGTEYVYGAVRCHDGKGNLNKNFTVSAFDCSSLTQYIFYKGADGLLLDVTTRTQVLQGEAVAKDGIQRGDLLFFTNSSRQNNSGIERIGHVALYLGDNMILHTSSDYAKIEAISSQRWGYFICARRMV